MSDTQTRYYSAHGSPRIALQTQWLFVSELDYLAQECAEDFSDNYGGAFGTWPVEFTLYETATGSAIAKVLVKRHFNPEFTAGIVVLE